MEPLSKVYVKIFTKAKNGAETFFKDGYTDINGKFDYANASGKSLEAVTKFSVLICHREYGAIISEYKLPSKGAVDERQRSDVPKRYGREIYGSGHGRQDDYPYRDDDDDDDDWKDPD